MKQLLTLIIVTMSIVSYSQSPTYTLNEAVRMLKVYRMSSQNNLCFISKDKYNHNPSSTDEAIYIKESKEFQPDWSKTDTLSLKEEVYIPTHRDSIHQEWYVYTYLNHPDTNRKDLVKIKH